MRTSRFAVLVAAVATAASAPFLLTGCVIPSPSPGPNAALYSVAAVNAQNAWAVGSFVDANGSHDFMEHWNGTSWQKVWLPAPFGHWLSSVTVVNGHNVWAVSDVRTLHFGGLGWSSLPNPAGTAMFRVASAPDAAVYGLGHTASSDTLSVMTAGGWRAVAAMPTSAFTQGCDVSKSAVDLAVVRANDVWVVGNDWQARPVRGCSVALHWNGTAWRATTLPALPGTLGLAAVSARTSSDVWAGGWRTTVDPISQQPVGSSVMMHWNGSTWALVPTLDRLGEGSISDIDATGDGVWAVGEQVLPRGTGTAMLIKKWNGTAMVDQPVQLLPLAQDPRLEATYGGDLNAVSVRDGVVTSVGNYQPRNGIGATLTDRRNAT